MTQPSETALEDMRRRLDQLQAEVLRLGLIGRATVNALAVVSEEARAAVQAALEEGAAADELVLEAQADLLDIGAELQALATPQTRLARELERALVAEARRLDQRDEAELQRQAG